MKSESYILINDNVRNNAIMRIKDLECKGKFKITISNAGDRSARQNSLLWLWHTFVANSGIGSYDEKEAVHRSVKSRWIIPILIRDDEFFAELYRTWKFIHGSDVDRMNWFVDNQVSSATLSTHQMAEVLTQYQRFYLTHGVPLPDPEDKKLLEWKK